MVGHQRTVVDERAEELLDVEGVALGRIGDPGAHRGRERATGHERVDQLERRPFGQWLEQDRRGVELAAAPRRTVVQELGTRRADEEDRRVPRQVGDRLDEVEQGRLGPVDVVDEDDERPLVGEVLQRATERPDELFLGRRRLETDEADEAARDRRCLRQSGDERVDPLTLRLGGVAFLDAGRLPDDLGDRPGR